MGCSSSALNKAGNSSKLRSEESDSCFAQSKPRTPGRESTIYGKIQKESLPPLEKLNISVVSTANGVKSLHEQPLANDAADPPGSIGKTQTLEGLKESGPPQPGGKDDTAEAEEKEKDVEAVTEAQPSEGNTATEPLGTEAKHQPWRRVGERNSPGTLGGAENPQTASKMKPLGVAGNVPPLEAGREPQPQEAVGKDEQPQLSEPVPKETESPEILEGSQLVETEKEQQLQGTLGRDEQSQLLGTIPKESGSSETLEGSQLVKTTPKCPGHKEQIQPEGIVGSTEHPAGILQTGTTVEMVRKTHSNKEDQIIEGETGEMVETEMENKRVSEGAEAKEEETGEAMDLSTAT